MKLIKIYLTIIGLIGIFAGILSLYNIHYYEFSINALLFCLGASVTFLFMMPLASRGRL